jgi:arsenate reductase
MGCSVEKICPAPLFKKVTDWRLEDPKGLPIEKVREIRDEIERKVTKLLENIDSQM